MSNFAGNNVLVVASVAQARRGAIKAGAGAGAPALLLRGTIRKMQGELQRTVANAKHDALKQERVIHALETQLQEFAARNGELLTKNRQLALEAYTFESRFYGLLVPKPVALDPPTNVAPDRSCTHYGEIPLA